MAHRNIFLITGATSGLGLETAIVLANADKANMIIVGARNPLSTDALRKAIAEDQLTVLELDTSSQESVRRFAAEAQAVLGSNTLAGVALNAGIQIVSGDQFSVDGDDLTFATNVLGHIALNQYLQPVLSPSTIIVSTASGTHDKDHKLASAYKFYGGFFLNAALVAAGKVSGATDAAQQGRDRYATSKLCNILFTYAMGRKHGLSGPRYIAFDPGLMPGTELARDQPATMRFAWKNILPTAAKLIDGASTAKRSGAMLAQILMGQRFPDGTGLHTEFTGKAIPSSRLSYDEAIQDALMAWAEERRLALG